MQRKPLVAANWKMNGTLSSVNPLLDDILQELDESDSADVVICPPYVYIPVCAAKLADSRIQWGSQNVSEKSEGAYTGEISCDMLKDFSCRFAIIGHSERRTLYGETNTLIAAKFAQLVENDLIPILCVGELLEERESNRTEAVIEEQLNTVINAVGIHHFSDAVIAYEPVWAIGTGKTASPEQAQEVHAFIRDIIRQHDERLATTIRILYGGSVKPGNAKELFSMVDVDGGLIGGASLQAGDFISICHAMR